MCVDCVSVAAVISAVISCCPGPALEHVVFCPSCPARGSAKDQDSKRLWPGPRGSRAMDRVSGEIKVLTNV